MLEGKAAGVQDGLPEYPDHILHKKKSERTPKEQKEFNRIAQARFRHQNANRAAEMQSAKRAGTINVILAAEEKQALKEKARERFTTVSALVAGVIRENILQVEGK